MESKSEIDLKEGHALPATKLAGGVRVKPHKHHSNGEKVKERSNSESSDVEDTSSTSPKLVKHHPIISGAQTKGDSDFKTEAIKKYMDKPVKVSNQSMNGPKNTIIHQPKK